MYDSCRGSMLVKIVLSSMACSNFAKYTHLDQSVRNCSRQLLIKRYYQYNLYLLYYLRIFENNIKKIERKEGRERRREIQRERERRREKTGRQ